MPSTGSPSRWRGAAASVATADENNTGASRSPVRARAPVGDGEAVPSGEVVAAARAPPLPELPLELRSLSEVLPPPDPRLLEDGLAEAAAARQRRSLDRRALCHEPNHGCGAGEGQEQSDALGNMGALFALYEATGGAGWGHWISGSSSTFVSSNDGWPGSAADAINPANDPCLNVIGVSAGHWEGVGCVNGDVRHMYASPPLPPLPRSACLALRH